MTMCLGMKSALSGLLLVQLIPTGPLSWVLLVTDIISRSMIHEIRVLGASLLVCVAEAATSAQMLFDRVVRLKIVLLLLCIYNNVTLRWLFCFY